MICVCLAEISFAECLAAVKQLDFAEIRIDLLDLTSDQLHAVFAANQNLIATCRPGKYSETERKALLLDAVAAGAAYVDVEMEAGDAFKNEIMQAAKARNCQIIVSYHDFEKTPPRPELEHIVRWCAECDPDIIKIACTTHSDRDNARLLGLLDSDRRMLVIGMGAHGKITRVVSPLLGSFCTFAAYAADKSTGPGQLSQEVLASLLNQMQQL